LPHSLHVVMLIGTNCHKTEAGADSGGGPGGPWPPPPPPPPPHPHPEHIHRCHIVDEFNRGMYDYIVATDEVLELQPGKKKGQQHRRKRDKEYSVSRGLDFQGL